MHLTFFPVVLRVLDYLHGIDALSTDLVAHEMHDAFRAGAQCLHVLER